MARVLLIAMTGYEAGDRRRMPEGDFDVVLLKLVDPTEVDRLLRDARLSRLPSSPAGVGPVDQAGAAG